MHKMAKLDRAAMFCLAAILAGWIFLLVFGEAQFDKVDVGRFHLPWGILNMRQWSRETLQKLQMLGLVLGFVLVAWPVAKWGSRARSRFSAFTCTILLCLVVLGTGIVMAKHVMTRRAYFDYYDTYHYLLGARYFEELGYDQHYTCTVVALQEVKKQRHPRRIRKLTDNRRVRVNKKFFRRKHAKRCRESFSEDRLEDFGQDVKWFRKWFSRRKWEQALNDHGYNGPPPLTAITKLLSDGVSINKAGLIYLGLFNLVVLYSMAISMVWAFGWRLALAFFAFFWMCPVDPFLTISAFIRYLWIAALVGGFAFLQRRKYAVAGGLLGLSASLKLFPIVFLIPMALRAIESFFLKKRIDTKYWRLGGGALLSMSALWTLGFFYGGGLDAWTGFFEQMDLNAGRFSTGRIGFIYNFVYPKETFEELGSYLPRIERMREARWGSFSLEHLRWALTLLMLALAARATRKMNDTMATIYLGFCLHFCLFNVVRYYYTAFVGLPLMWHLIRGGVARSMWAWLWAMALVPLLLKGFVVDRFIFNTFYPFMFSAYILVVVVLAEKGYLDQGSSEDSELPSTGSQRAKRSMSFTFR